MFITCVPPSSISLQDILKGKKLSIIVDFIYHCVYSTSTRMATQSMVWWAVLSPGEWQPCLSLSGSPRKWGWS